MPASEINLDHPPEGFRLEVGDVIRFDQSRIFPLGTVFVNVPETLLEIRDTLAAELERRGISTAFYGASADDPSAFRATFTVWLRVEGFHAAGELDAEEVQEAGVALWAGAVLALAVLVTVGYIVHEAATVARDVPEAVAQLSGATGLVATAVAVVALVYLLSR